MAGTAVGVPRKVTLVESLVALVKEARARARLLGDSVLIKGMAVVDMLGDWTEDVGDSVEVYKATHHLRLQKLRLAVMDVIVLKVLVLMAGGEVDLTDRSAFEARIAHLFGQWPLDNEHDFWGKVHQGVHKAIRERSTVEIFKSRARRRPRPPRKVMVYQC